MRRCWRGGLRRAPRLQAEMLALVILVALAVAAYTYGTTSRWSARN